ncbi:hypothetical protein A0H76_2165 [Hepatospora eriocheir]|uniref:Uncharacterized protein n=1 Tax=Hepatospora eriocheir TaxID=1081669 RepID=A0A1X0QFT8_9MICR|nr:hypothetical protein A0H76_2165 [Hepatospora eriocheir]
MDSSNRIREKITEIQNNLLVCRGNLSQLGNVNIQLKALLEIINTSNLEEGEKIEWMDEYNKLNDVFNELQGVRQEHKSKLSKDVNEANITTKRFSENYMSQDHQTNDEFYSNEGSRIDKIIAKGMDSLENLKRQDVYINSINNRLKGILNRLGVSNTTIADIENRSFGDKTLFIILILSLILLIILLKFINK